MSTATVADIFRAHWDEYCRRYKPSPLQGRVAAAVMHCRTPELGGHQLGCSTCGYRQVVWNSCRNRHCPQCGGDKAARWLEERRAELLPVNYFHTVFTLPRAFQPIARRNKKLVYSLLFTAASKTLLKVGRKRHGGELGFFCVLHTWGATLNFHPHIHCVIPGCAIAAKGITAFGRFLAPDRVLSSVFRGIFISLIKRAQRKNKLVGQFDDFEAFLSSTCQRDWVVRTKPPFAGPEVVLKYLARYTQRIAISNKRLVSFNRRSVTFTYRDYKRAGIIRQMKLPPTEFMRRFLQHVLPHHFVRIRHFGFMSRSKRRTSMAQLTPFFRLATKEPALNPQVNACPHCGGTQFGLLTVIPSPRQLLYAIGPPAPRRSVAQRLSTRRC